MQHWMPSDNYPSCQNWTRRQKKEELRKAIDCLSAGKAPGEDGIPGKVIKAGEELIDDLIKLLCPCRKEGSVTQDMRGAKIVTLYKNKRNRSDRNSYQGVSLLNIIVKLFLPESSWQRACNRVPVWVQSKQIHHWHDFPRETTAGEVPGAE